MKKPSDRQRVIEVYRLARAVRDRLQPWARQWSIFVGKPDDGGRQIGDQCSSPWLAWRSAWFRIEAAREHTR
jgi:hypothetical protein